MKQQGFAPIFILIGIVVLVGVVGVIYHLSKNIVDPDKSISSTNTPLEKSDSTEDWKTFINKEAGYSIKYPDDKFLECNIQGDTTKFNLFTKEGGNDICFAGEGPAFLRFSVNPDLTRLKTPYPPSCYDVIEEQIKVLNFEGRRYTNQIKKDTGICEQASKMAKNEVMDVFEYQGKTYLFYYYKNRDINLVNQIISTLKFLEPDETTDWKTYKSWDGLYSIRYPKDWQFLENKRDDSNIDRVQKYYGSLNWKNNDREYSAHFILISTDIISQLNLEKRTDKSISKEERFYNLDNWRTGEYGGGATFVHLYPQSIKFGSHRFIKQVAFPKPGGSVNTPVDDTFFNQIDSRYYTLINGNVLFAQLIVDRTDPYNGAEVTKFEQILSTFKLTE